MCRKTGEIGTVPGDSTQAATLTHVESPGKVKFAPSAMRRSVFSESGEQEFDGCARL